MHAHGVGTEGMQSPHAPRFEFRVALREKRGGQLSRIPLACFSGVENLWRPSVGRLLDPYSSRPFTLQVSLRVKPNTHALVLSAKLRTIHNLRSTVSL